MNAPDTLMHSLRIENSLVPHARQLIHTPWEHMGRTDRGLDCAGLIILAAKMAGFPPLIDPAPYSNRPVPVSAYRKFLKNFKPISKRLHGAIVCVRILKIPTHIGILTLDKTFPTIIHANRRGVEEEFISDDKDLGLLIRCSYYLEC